MQPYTEQSSFPNIEESRLPCAHERLLSDRTIVQANPVNQASRMCGTAHLEQSVQQETGLTLVERLLTQMFCFQRFDYEYSAATNPSRRHDFGVHLRSSGARLSLLC
jgi:hypothetical protein